MAPRHGEKHGVFLLEVLNVAAEAVYLALQAAYLAFGERNLLVEPFNQLLPFVDVAVYQLQFGHGVFFLLAGLVELLVGLLDFLFQFLFVGFEGLPVLCRRIGKTCRQQQNA